jgi:CDP-glucose 4,6-dehydratase
VTSAYRSSYFNSNNYDKPSVAVATARAGNVIGGGDWAIDRLIPDCINSLLRGEKIRIRNPYAIRPWQHVLEPLSGYLTLAQRLYESGTEYAEGWNFGPADEDARTVGWIVEHMCEKWSSGAAYEIDEGNHPHEAHFLKLDCSKSRARLLWQPKWHLEKTLGTIIDWTHSYRSGDDLRRVCLEQIADYIGNPN